MSTKSKNPDVSREARQGRPRARRWESAEEARREILAAARQRLAAGGPEAVRLQNIAGDLGVTHPTILHHFGSRQGLVDALEEEAFLRLQEDLLADPNAFQGDTALARALETLADEGQARLLAWRVLREPDRRVPEDERLLRHLGDAYHRAREDRAREGGAALPTYEDTAFWVRLCALAMFGEALIGSQVTESAELGPPEEVAQRFRQWLGDLLDRYRGGPEGSD